MEIQKYNFIITSEPNSVNDFDEIIGTQNGDDIAIGNLLKFNWFPHPPIRFYDFNEFLSDNADLAIPLCSDNLLIRLYKESICLIAYLKNISITSFPEEQSIVKEKFQQNQNYEKKFILDNQTDSFYKLFTYNIEGTIKNAINIHRLVYLIKHLEKRGLSDKVIMDSDDITAIFSAERIIRTQGGRNIFLFCHIPTNGNHFSLLEKYVDDAAEFIDEKERNQNISALFELNPFFNDFVHMCNLLNENKDEHFKQITKKYMNICSKFMSNYPGLLSPKYCNFSKELLKLKKNTKSFAHSILETKSEISNVDFDMYDTKTILINIISVLNYQKDKHDKIFDPKYIKSTLLSQFKTLNVGTSDSHGDTLYFTFFNQEKLDPSIFNSTIQNFISIMLQDVLKSKKNFTKEYEILINQAILENDLLKNDLKDDPNKVIKINKF